MIWTGQARPWLPWAATAGAVIAGLAAFISPVIALALLGVSAAALLLLNPVVGIPLIIVASAMNRVALLWGDAPIRLEIIVVLLLLGVLINRWAVRSMSLTAIESPLLKPLLAYLAVNILSTLMFAVERTRGLKLDAEIAAAVASFLVMSALLRRRASLELAVRVLWVVTVVEAALGVLALLAYAAHLSSLGVQEGDFKLPMAYGTEWEANIFGSFLLGNFFILLADYLRGRRTLWRTAGLVIVVAGIGVSMTRTVWLALVLCTIAFLAMVLRVRRPGNALLPVMVATPVIAVAGLIIGSATPFAGRLLDLIDLQSSSAHGRLLLFQAAVQDWQHHPLLGTGTGSFNFGALPGQPHPWLPNLMLLSLHDTGIVGFAVVLWLLLAFFIPVLRRVAAGGDLALTAAGAAAGFAGLVICFQTTSGFWFAYPWVVAALGLAAARLPRELES